MAKGTWGIIEKMFLFCLPGIDRLHGYGPGPSSSCVICWCDEIIFVKSVHFNRAKSKNKLNLAKYKQ